MIFTVTQANVYLKGCLIRVIERVPYRIQRKVYNIYFLLISILAQQLSGINCAIFYSTSIFKSAGLDEQASQSATLGMGAMNVAMTIISLILIEKAGRKTLMLSGLSVMILTTTMLLICLAAAVSWIFALMLSRWISDRN